MNWTSFFAGASLMLFVLVILVAVWPIRENKNNRDSFKSGREDMKLFHEYWGNANKLAQQRNNLLAVIASNMCSMSQVNQDKNGYIECVDCGGINGTHREGCPFEMPNGGFK